LNRLIRCVCGKKIGPDPRNFNQRVSLGRNDLLIRTFLSTGQKLKSAEIKFYRSNDAGQEVEYFSTLLEGVKIASVCPMMLDIKDPDYEKHNHLELVELLYEKITWRYVDGNIMHSDSWNDRKTA
ncbi:type VI secretion system tube protein TssD, partial [Enterobacter hormaechei]|uniref:type VI secretion system tube protein TssD n=1 Tax=Enterobacter hormaechei TaxID=158836 RepID=UPI003D6DDA27